MAEAQTLVVDNLRKNSTLQVIAVFNSVKYDSNDR